MMHGFKCVKTGVLVNHAGGLSGRSHFEEMTTDFYRNVLGLNAASCKRTWSGHCCVFFSLSGLPPPGFRRLPGFADECNPHSGLSVTLHRQPAEETAHR